MSTAMDKPTPESSRVPQAAAGSELVLSRTFDVPRSAVFAAWTDPAALPRWFGPHGSAMPVCRLDPRPGGELHYEHTFEEHEDVWVKGVYEEVAAPERLVFTCHFSNPSGARRERPGFPAEMRIDVRFEALDAARTKVTVRQSGLERDQGEVHGWIEAFERLAGELAHMGGGVFQATMFVYPPAQPIILQRRVFAAPRALVWASCTEAQHMAAWWGPRGYVNEACEVDARPGGSWRVAQRAPDGALYTFMGEFREVTAPERFVCTFAMEGMFEERPVVETHTFAEREGSTHYAVESRFASMEDRAAMMATDMEVGARQAMDRLEEILDALAPTDSERELVLSRLIRAPRELVFQAWTRPEHVDRWMGPHGFTTVTRSMDVRVGGAWLYTMTSPDGTVYPNRVTYRAIQPPARLEYLHDAGQDNDPHGFEVEVTFAEEAGGTRVRMRMRLASKEARDATIAFGAVELGYQTLARLAGHVEVDRAAV